jgi:hypothetical protein
VGWEEGLYMVFGGVAELGCACGGGLFCFNQLFLQ